MAVVGIVTDLANFGAAGLMGAMWLWERRLSRTRERQLGEAHSRILRDEQRLELLTQVVEHNTGAVSRFSETQRQVIETLRDLIREFFHDHGKTN
jgi:hypothetical protein